MDRNERIAELIEVCSRIPAGRVASYGAVGQCMTNRPSGLVVGRWMANFGDQLPWWRVVGAKGDLLVGRRDPSLAITQRQMLESEGIEFDEATRVLARFFHTL
jgi:methylated-DNA-protein-cysteine methyltransferase related protein